MDKASEKVNILPKTAKDLLLLMVKPYKLKTFFFFFLTFLGIIAWTASPFLVSVIVTKLANSPVVDTYIWALAIAFFVLRALDDVLWRLGEFVMFSYKPQMIERVRTVLFSATLKKNHEYYVNSNSGRIAHWINVATQTADEFWDITIWTVWGRVIGLIISAIFLLTVHWSLAVLFSVWLVLLFWYNIYRGRRFAELIAAQSDEHSKAAGIIVDSLSNHLSVRVFNARIHENDRLVRQQKNIIKRWRKSWRQNIVTNIVKGQSSAVISGLALALVLFLFANGTVQLGGVVLLIAYFGDASSSLWQLAWAFDSYYRNFGTIQNALNGLQAKDEPISELDSSDYMPEEVSLSLKNLSFSYPNEVSGKVLKSINLEIPAGVKVGIVGHSGSGKSTLVGLLLGLYKPSSGRIEINGVNIAAKDPSYIRTISSFVPQDTSLFNRTVKENVIYASPKATKSQFFNALKKAEAFDFIQELPKGVDTMIGERGVKLSGGQRQRIAIARAILKDTPLLILDEATSALDSVNEQSIQKSLHKLMKGRTAIVIAHRLSTLKHLDKIIVLDCGKIIEQGKHEDLIRNNGIYSDLWERQKNGFIVDD